MERRSGRDDDVRSEVTGVRREAARAPDADRAVTAADPALDAEPTRVRPTQPSAGRGRGPAARRRDGWWQRRDGPRGPVPRRARFRPETRDPAPPGRRPRPRPPPRPG